MSGKPKFKPEITRVRLNPEQAVLTCACYNESWRAFMYEPHNWDVIGIDYPGQACIVNYEGNKELITWEWGMHGGVSS